MNKRIFLNEGRAAKVAQALSQAGHRVGWSPEKPFIVETDAGDSQIKNISAATPGADPEWRTRAAIKIEG